MSVGFDQEAAGAELGAGDAMARQFAIQCAEIADETKWVRVFGPSQGCWGMQ